MSRKILHHSSIHHAAEHGSSQQNHFARFCAAQYKRHGCRFDSRIPATTVPRTPGRVPSGRVHPQGQAHHTDVTPPQNLTDAFAAERAASFDRQGSARVFITDTEPPQLGASHGEHFQKIQTSGLIRSACRKSSRKGRCSNPFVVELQPLTTQFPIDQSLL
jgi:hypothetical protein